ncbi:PREDICTED: uncharacterized protein LOC106302734 [Brassica oleracea var. oleracea]|uniref:uncharacterized protein LOC106302734 n=1 Tax=Brassica oleracea var. oleracea TaxID=109376 RepID=UPI0006A71538|nr:PREDICTED: uncharacterized protein LOC106302734 [Brassica oleracea var. oleracea]
MNSVSNGDFMTQTTHRAFELIENMAVTLANQNEESECSKKGNSSDTQKIDELTTKGQQVQAKALNQVTTEIDTRMGNMFTELNAKYDAVASHIRKIDVQLAQTAESVKRQQGMLPGKTDKNPRTEHYNAIEQPFAETVLGTEENTELSASSGATAPSEPAETAPVRVYVPKVPYPIPPKHLMDPISAEQLAGFRKMVSRFPKEISFEHAWEIQPLRLFFKNCRESQEEIKALFTEALTPSLKVLPKVDDPGKFVFPCSIAGVEFKEALCDSRSSVNLISKAIVDELGIVHVEPSQLKMAFANSSMAVVGMSKDHEMPLIFGRSFMPTVGAVVDMPNKKVSFSNINKEVFYKELGKKGEIKEVLDGDPHTDTKKLSGNVKVNEKV